MYAETHVFLFDFNSESCCPAVGLTNFERLISANVCVCVTLRVLMYLPERVFSLSGAIKTD